MTFSTQPEHQSSTGARPIGAADEGTAATAVRQMFDTIAPKYDLLNHLLSVGLDRWWWSRTARTFRPILQRPEAVALDLCCGTGDMTLALLKHRPSAANEAPIAPILAVDFSHQMLSRGAQKFAPHNIVAIEADALHLPLADSGEGLTELRRVLRPGGQIGILDCNQPDGLVGALYNLYFKTILPRLGGLISGEPRAYSYLPASVERFPRPPRMLQLITNAGFTSATWTSYTCGTAGLYRASKS